MAGEEAGASTASSKTLLELLSESDVIESTETLMVGVDQPLVLVPLPVAGLADRMGLASLALEGMFLLLCTRSV